MDRPPAIYLHQRQCRTALGDARQTWQALVDGRIALRPTAPLPGSEDRVPLALTGGLDGALPPRWLADASDLLAECPNRPWGHARFPVVITSSNFGIDQMLPAYQGGHGHDAYAAASNAVRAIAEAMHWEPNRAIISNACVSAQLGLIHAERLLVNDLADDVLVFSFDTLSHFVVGGFYALKILNGDFPQPYAQRESGSIGLGDGAAFAVVSRTPSPLRLAASASHSEFHHMTGNDASGAGFDAVFAPLAQAAAGRKVWIKGHGTGTLEAGRLEAEAAARAFPDAPLVSWKGSLGHTLGSCGLVELAIAAEAFEQGTAPGCLGATGDFFSPNVNPQPFALGDFVGVVLVSSAFGGAHAGHLLLRDD